MNKVVQIVKSGNRFNAWDADGVKYTSQISSSTRKKAFNNGMALEQKVNKNGKTFWSRVPMSVFETTTTPVIDVSSVDVPTIGIGAGSDCDGQVLVLHDLLGFEKRIIPKFVRSYAQFHVDGVSALREFVTDVKSGSFPSEEESYCLSSETSEELGLYGAI